MGDDGVKRLEEIQQQLAEVLEERLAALNEAIATSEAVTRRIVSAEMEISRHRQQETALSADVEKFEAELDALQEQANELADKHAALAKERGRLQAETTKLEKEVDAAQAEVEATKKEVEAAQQEADDLRAETNGLKTKHATLQENITRMQALKDELMHSISGLTQQMHGLAGGGTE